MSDNNIPVFSSAYFPPVSCFIEMIKHETILLETKEHFIKQTWRNRCHIAGANGLQRLVVPLQHQDLSHTPMDEVLISYEENWQKIHYRSFKSAYANAPFYEFFADEFESLFEKKYERLFDLNVATLNFLLKNSRKKLNIHLTEEYIQSYVSDFRNHFHPKKETHSTTHYHQVFEDKNGFIRNVSALDMLFNCGAVH